ncbi:MAG: AAC(3) family N-acetyltransferase [Streptococcaceae bacterium]|nr:AAC(3) family N-acetyltransferase [Streptococcaceae bacterium]
MYTKEQLKKQLATIGVNPKGVLKVHLSYKAIGELENGGDTVLEALMEYMKEGLLVLPTHTWRNINDMNPVFDVLYTPSCVGYLTESFRQKKGVVRSLHPTHSVSAIGKGAEELVKGDELLTSPCGKGGAYHKLYEANAQVLLIGVNFMRNTIVHGFEEWNGVPNILNEKAVELITIPKQGERIKIDMHRHISRLGSRTFAKLEPRAIMEGVLTLGRFGDADTRLMNAKPLFDLVSDELQKDLNYLQRY